MVTVGRNMTASRTIKINKLTVTVNNVPDEYTDDEIKAYILSYFFKLSKLKALKEIGRDGINFNT